MTDEEVAKLISTIELKSMYYGADEMWGKALQLIWELQAENAALRERLENAIEVPFVFNKKVFVIVHGKKGNFYLFEGIVTGIGTDTNKLYEGEIALLMSVVNKSGEAHFINGKQYRKQWFCEDEIEYAEARITELNGENNNG